MIEDLITNINNEPNIHIDNKMLGAQYYDIFLYNKDVLLPMAKNWFYLDKIKIIDKNKNKITIVFSSIGDKKFIEYIEKINLLIKNYLNINKIDESSRDTPKTPNKVGVLSEDIKEYINTISNQDFPNILINTNNATFFNYNDEEITFNDINNNSYNSVFIELHKVIYYKKQIRYEWNLLSLKTHQEINFKKSLFFNKKEINNITNTKTPECIIPTPPPLNKNLNNPICDVSDNKINNPKTVNQTIYKPIISLDDIIKQKNALNKIQIKKNSIDNDKENKQTIISSIPENGSSESIHEPLFKEMLSNEKKNISNRGETNSLHTNSLSQSVHNNDKNIISHSKENISHSYENSQEDIQEIKKIKKKVKKIKKKI
jgi:hypothetical protein